MNFDIKSWGLQEISACLSNSGYGPDDLLDAKFSHVSASDPGCLVFEVAYEDIDGMPGHGKVYVSLRDGVLCADY